MKIIEQYSELGQIFDAVNDSKITIVSAFASGTESIVKGLTARNNVELIVGTINSFSSPKYIENLIDLESENLNIYMDFRYANSTHWKLYLIEPNVVIIGSANFTALGVSLKRDTLVFLESEDLYNEYLTKVENLKSSPLVLNCQEKNFEHQFELYKQSFFESQAANQSVKAKSTLDSWLADDHNQAIPLFIWDRELVSETYQQAFELIQDQDPEVESEESYRLSTYTCKPKDLPYREGSLVITMSEKGSYIQFERFDRILYKDGVHYLYSFKGKRKNAPFDISEITMGIKSIVSELYDKEQAVLYREDIESIVKK